MKGSHFRLVNTWLMVIVLAALLLLVFEPFILPLTWAAVLAVFFNPMHRRMGTRVKNPRLAAFCSTMLVTVVLIVPASFVIPLLIRELIHMLTVMPTSEFIERVQQLVSDLPTRFPILSRLGPGLQVETLIGEMAEWGRALVAHESASLAGGLASSLFHLILTLFILYYFFLGGRRMVDRFSRLTLIEPERWEHLVGEVDQMVRATVWSTFLVAGFHGCAGALIFWILGVPSPVVAGLGMAICSPLPVVGALAVWWPVAAWYLYKKAYAMGVLLLVIGTVLVPGFDLTVKPLLISGGTRLNPLVVLLSVLGGVAAFGAVGFVAGPVITAVSAALLHAFLGPEEKISDEEPVPSEAFQDPPV